MQTIYKMVIKWLANLKGADNKFTFADIDNVAGWVVEENEKDPDDKVPGVKKAEVVVGLFNEKWQGRAKWVVTTVVQLCYAFVQIKKLSK